MDCEKAYFYLTTNFQPDYSADFLWVEEDIYKHKATGNLYKKLLLADFGWGQEYGYVCYPLPTFDELIALIEYKPKGVNILTKRQRERNVLCANNWFGAISLIMQSHLDELMLFLEDKTGTDYFENKYIRKRFRRFVFDRKRAKEFGITVGGSVKGKTYEEVFQSHKKWQNIAETVIDLVYRK